MEPLGVWVFWVDVSLGLQPEIDSIVNEVLRRVGGDKRVGSDEGQYAGCKAEQEGFHRRSTQR